MELEAENSFLCSAVLRNEAVNPTCWPKAVQYCEPYATGHATLDRDEPVQDEARNVACAVAKAVIALRAARLQAMQPILSRSRPK
jgi:hypothetical protein